MRIGRGLETIVSVAVLAVAALSAGAAERAPAYRARVINPKLLGGAADASRGVFVIWGTDGTILRSRDGEHWEHADTPTGQDLASAAVDSARNLWVAVGAAGTVLRSSDGARSWQRMATPPGLTADLRVVLFDAASGAWLAAGTDGTLLRSIDGGSQLAGGRYTLSR